MCFVSRIIDPLTRDVPIMRKQVNPYAVNTRDENVQKQPSRGVLKKRCSENMQQIFENMQHMRKCDVSPIVAYNNNVASLHYSKPSGFCKRSVSVNYFNRRNFHESKQRKKLKVGLSPSKKTFYLLQ